MDKKFAFQIVGLLLVTFVAMAFTFNSGSLLGGNRNISPESGTTSVENQLLIIDGEDRQTVKSRLDLEIADTQEKRSRGLSGRQSLPEESGMLFMLETEGRPTFWMKQMQIRLDLIWILDNRVVDILADVPIPEPGQQDDTLPRYSPVTEVNRVLEVNAGYAAKKGIKIGDTIQIVPKQEASPSQ